MKIPLFLALLALPLAGAGAARAQSLQSSVTSFDRYGNPSVQYTSPSSEDYARDGLRSSVTTFGPNGVPSIQYTSPALNPTGITQPASIAGLLANQNIYGQSAPFNGYGGYYPGYGAGYGAGYGYGYGYGYNAPAYPYTVPLGQSKFGFNPPTSITVIPIPSANTYPAPAYPYGGYGYGYGAPAYPYPAPGYGYPTGYAYPPGYAYPYGQTNTSYYSQGAGYGVRVGNGKFGFSIGGSNVSSNTTTTVRRR